MGVYRGKVSGGALTGRQSVKGGSLSARGHLKGGALQISVPILQSKTAIPEPIAQTITADEGYGGLSQVVVEPIPSNWGLITWNGSVITVS